MREVRWAVVGCGDVAARSVVPALNDSEHSVVTHVVGRTAARAESFAQRNGIRHWGTDLEQVLTQGGVDVVYIATPTAMHGPLAMLCAAAAVPTVVEKPLATSFVEAQSLLDAFSETGTPAWVAYYRRSMPKFIRIRELVQRGGLGEVVGVRSWRCQPYVDVSMSNWRRDPQQQPGGLFAEGACHELDLWAWICGTYVTMTGAADAAAEVLSGSWISSTGVVGSGFWCYRGHERANRHRIVGTLRTLSFDMAPDSDIVLRGGPTSQRITTAASRFRHGPMLDAVVADLGEGRANVHAMESGLSTQWAIERLLSGARMAPGHVGAPIE